MLFESLENCSTSASRLDGSCDKTALLKFPGAKNAAVFKCVPQHLVPSVSCGRRANLLAAALRVYLEMVYKRSRYDPRVALITEDLNGRINIYKYSYDTCQ